MKKILKLILGLVKNIALVFILAFFIKYFLVQTFLVEGVSMMPNYKNNDFVIVDKISYQIRDPKYGEVIVFKPKINQDISYIKRVVGLPGDKVEIKSGNVYINSFKINEPYLDGKQTMIENRTDYLFSKTLRSDEYFVLGDNRNNSQDSRSIGPITKESITGRVFIVIYPFSDARLVSASEGYDNAIY